MMQSESFYKVYKSGKVMIEAIERIEARGLVEEAELELARGFKAATETLEKSYPHYLERYNREKAKAWEYAA